MTDGITEKIFRVPDLVDIKVIQGALDLRVFVKPPEDPDVEEAWMEAVSED